MDDWRDQLATLLEDGQHIGALGPGDLEAQIDHSLGFARLIDDGVVRAMDLGTGAGLPGLALAGALPDIEWILVDAAARRIRVVERAVRALGWEKRVLVVHGRAEDLGADEAWRSTCQAVIARSFGPAAVVAECARPFLTPGGSLVVAEPPPDAADPAIRWPEDGLITLGYAIGRRIEDPGMQELIAEGDVPDRLPRRSGMPAKRPVW